LVDNEVKVDPSLF